MVYDHKYDETGNLVKLKTRIAVRGTEKHMQPGVHYDPNTYSATPSMTSQRILMAIVVKYNLTQKCWDITKAYTWAELKDSELIILKYPKGFERYDPNTGEELFMIMRRNLYGTPSAAKNYSDKRDKFILEAFNKNGWTCRKSTMDPCIFLIERKGDDANDRENAQRTWLLAYVDDIDCASENPVHVEMIFDIMNKEWPCKVVISSYMLGIKRTTTESDGIRSMKLSMEAYVEGMYNAFKSFVPTKTLHTPCEHNLLLSLENESTEEENQRVMKRGFQRAVGMLLWAARGVFPQTLYTLGQLCKLMSRPTEQSWEAAMHLIAWMHQHRHEGISFHSNGNIEPFFMSDASNKPDLMDSKRAYGACGIWMGGPIISFAKKLEHSSSATAANEYMALSHAAKHAIWLRQLFNELGLRLLVARPTVIFADNETANKWCSDERITAGNMWILQCYHYVKELTGEHIVIQYVNTKHNIADLFTKGVPKEVFQALAPYLCGNLPILSLLNMIEDQGGKSL